MCGKCSVCLKSLLRVAASCVPVTPENVANAEVSPGEGDLVSFLLASWSLCFLSSGTSAWSAAGAGLGLVLSFQFVFLPLMQVVPPGNSA